MRENYQDARIIQRYKWLAEYHNKKFYEFYTKTDYYDDHYSEIEKNLVISLKIQRIMERLSLEEAYQEIGLNKFFLILIILIRTYFKIGDLGINILLEFIPRLNMMEVFRVVPFQNQNLGGNIL